MARGTTLALALAVAALCSGCGNEDDERDAAAAVTQLVEAIDRGDGARACEVLTDEASSALAEATGQTCETEVVKLEVSPSEVVATHVAITSAQVDLTGGDTFFLDETPEGWRVSAAGCEARPGGPYDCQVEG